MLSRYWTLFWILSVPVCIYTIVSAVLDQGEMRKKGWKVFQVEEMHAYQLSLPKSDSKKKQTNTISPQILAEKFECGYKQNEQLMWLFIIFNSFIIFNNEVRRLGDLHYPG